MTQKEAVIKYIKKYGSISPYEAFTELGITKLATVVSNLRLKQGLEIQIDRKTIKNRYGNSVTYAVYSFPKKKKG